MRKYTDYKDYVGPPGIYPLVGIAYRDLLDAILPEWDKSRLLDVGCGGLRIGKELMPRLEKGDYYGIEPYSPVLNEALEKEHGGRIQELFRPHFSDNERFDFDMFGVHFPVIISFAVFIHCGRSQLHQFLANIRDHVAKHGNSTMLVIDLRIEDDPKEIKPETGDTIYPNATHNVTGYAEEEVPTIMSRYGGSLVSSDSQLFGKTAKRPKNAALRSQHLVRFEP